jgi:hypothetical protein
MEGFWGILKGSQYYGIRIPPVDQQLAVVKAYNYLASHLTVAQHFQGT